MIREEAIKFQKFIEDLCERNNVYCSSTHDRKPDLKGIRLEVSIRIEQPAKENRKPPKTWGDG